MSLHSLFQTAGLAHFVLVLTRVSGLVMTAPVYGTAEVPKRVRVFLALAVTVLVAPLSAASPGETPASLIALGVMMLGELLIGVVLGMSMLILFSGVQIAGQLVSHVGGLSLGETIDPMTKSSVPVFSELLRWMTLAVFVGLGGHRMLLMALLDTFTYLPPGQAAPSESTTLAVSALVSESLVLGLRAAAPTLAATLLVNLVLGIISRVVPQLNVMTIGFGVTAIVAMVALLGSLGGVASVFEDHLEPFLDELVSALRASARPT